MMSASRRASAVTLAASVVLLVAASGCKRELPAPWRDVRFPLSQAKILPGADERGFHATYPAGTPVADLQREYQRALEAAGWSELKPGTSHDPDTGAYALIMQRGKDQLLLTVTAGTPVQARVNTSFD